MMDKEEARPVVPGHPVDEQPMTAAEVEMFRAALLRLLDSETFSGSRRMSSFLQFAGQAAIEGRTEIDQYEIAEQVLKRHEDFNPLDDASVRKLASQVRSKLEEYFEGEGAAEPVVISLPRRSYVLRFRVRSADAAPAAGARNEKERTGEAAPAPPAAPAAAASPVRMAWTLVPAAVALLGLGGWLGWQAAPRTTVMEMAADPAGMVIRTQRGDLRGAPMDVAPGAVRVGPPLEPGDDAVVELSFVPESATQQAGVMALGSPDHFVRFGQHFKDRAMLEQSYEVDASTSLMRSHFLADLQGQLGLPRWFALRRTGSQYEAFQSADSFAWRPFAPPLEVRGLPAEQRAAIYAFNGRSDGPSAEARFRGFRVGPAFHNRSDGPLRPEDFAGWQQKADCGDATQARISEGALEVSFPSSGVGCNWYFTRPVPEGDWSYAALMEFLPVSGSAAGLVVENLRGGNTHLSRRHFHTNIITVERTHDEDQRVNDFPGAPPVLLRFDMRGDVLSAWVSRDGRHFTPVGPGVRLTAARSDLRIGVYSMIAHWTSEGPRPPARFHWIQRLVEAPAPLQRAGAR